MLAGARIVLRARRRADVEPRHFALAGDYAVHGMSHSHPWLAQPLDLALAEYDRQVASPDLSGVWFSVARREDPGLEWIGEAGLWGLNQHQRSAHAGVALAPAVRGQGLAAEALRLLCDYAFRIRDLHRLGLETLATNEPMIRAARSVGFVEEGRLREGAYLLGQRVDEVLLGLLRPEWNPSD